MTASSYAGVRFVFFDAGNTLIHLDRSFIAKTLTESGYTASPETVLVAEYEAKRWVDCRILSRTAGNDRERQGSYFHVLLRTLGVDEPAVDRIVDELQRANAVESLWRVVDHDTPEVLAELRDRGFALGVISNADGRVEADLQRRGLGRFFATVVDSHYVGFEKPDPRIFAAALERLGATPAESIHIGDILSIDVRGAGGAGIRALLLDPLDRYGENCPRVRHLRQVLDLLPGRAAPERTAQG